MSIAEQFQASGHGGLLGYMQPETQHVLGSTAQVQLQAIDFLMRLREQLQLVNTQLNLLRKLNSVAGQHLKQHSVPLKRILMLI